MVTEGFEQYYKLGKTFLNPWNDIGKSFADIYRRANQGTLDMMGENLTRTADQLKRFSAIKRPEDLIYLQKECLNENVTAWMKGMQELINLSLGSFEELNKALTTNFKEQQQGAAASARTTERERAK